MKVIITAPSLDVAKNVSGVSAVTNFIIKLNHTHQYIHLKIGKKDTKKRGLSWVFGLIKMYFKWFYLMCTTSHFIHFNFPVDKRSVIRDVPMIMMAKLFRKRMVIHLHGGEFLMKEDVPRWMKIMISAALKGKDPVLCLSIVEKDFVTTKFKCDNAYWLPNAVDLTDATKVNRDIAADELPTLLFLGRLSVEKGIEFIYNALEQLLQTGLSFKFVMAGKGPAESEYKKKFAALLGDKFEFKGIVSGDSKTAVFKECNIFLLPSFWEGLPIALLEAMSFGLVPITTDVGAMKTVVIPGTNGEIVGVRSSTDIAAAITKLANNWGEMQRLSDNAKKLVFAEYNPDKYIKLLNKAYQYE